MTQKNSHTEDNQIKDNQPKAPSDNRPEDSTAPVEEKTSPTEEVTAEIEETSTVRTDESDQETQRSYGYWLLALFVIFTASLVSLSWYGWQLFQADNQRINSLEASQQNERSVLQQSSNENKQQISSLNGQLSALTKQVAQTESAIQKTSHALNDRVAAVENNLADIQNKLGQGERAWKAAEINFLLTRAQERLSISQDPAGAATALKLADQRLAELALPQVIPVRAAISHALTSLNKADDFDVVGMALRLRRVAASVSQWPLIGTQSNVTPQKTTNQGAVKDTVKDAVKPDTANPATAAQTTTPSPWYIRWPRDGWHHVTEWFSRQFTLTRSDQPVKASARASDDRETRLWLTAVRESLVSQDRRMLMPSLTEAQKWIRQHYATDNAEVRQALTSLKEIQDFYNGRQWPSFTPIYKAWAQSGLDRSATTQPKTPEAHP